jgi:DNA-binding response OmpR family regulator
MKILIIEDDDPTAAAVARGLEREGFIVERAGNGIDGLWLATESNPDLILLDLMLPGVSGFKVCSKLRSLYDWTPILVVSAKDGEFDQAEALDAGADGYLVKPFSFTVLLAQIRALLRRNGERPVAPDSVGDLTINTRQRRAWRGNREVVLTSRQFDVLEFLVRRAGTVQSKDAILAGVWRHDFDGDPNIVEVYIRRLRQAIDLPFERQTIETVRGAGYRLVDDLTPSPG